MDYTTLAAKRPLVTTEESIPLTSLYEAFQEPPDPRRAQGKRYEFALILSLLVSGQIGWTNELEWSDRMAPSSECVSGSSFWIGLHPFPLSNDVL